MKINKIFLNIILFFSVISTSAFCKTTQHQWYNHKTFILDHNNDNNSFPLPQEVENISWAYHSLLNTSNLFDTTNLKNTKYIAKEFDKLGAKEIVIETEDGIKSYASYFDRGNENIIIVGPGFTNVKEKMAPFIHMFWDKNYDFLIFNYRGHGKNPIKKSRLNPKNWKPQPLVSLFKHLIDDVDFSQVRLGKEEEKDIFAAVDFARNTKNYKKVIGLGICYSSLVFAKAQSIGEIQNKPLFSHLILDGCWHSLDAFREKLKEDLSLVFNPQRGGAPQYIKDLCKQAWFIKILQGTIEYLTTIKVEGLHVTEYLRKISIPKLFFYGKDDLTIERDQFEEIWKAAKSPKIGIITSNEHVWNHLKQKELFKTICELFIETESIEETLSTLKSPNVVDKFIHSQIRNKSKIASTQNIRRSRRQK